MREFERRKGEIEMRLIEWRKNNFETS